MPKFRGVSVSLQSQFDIMTIPEYSTASGKKTKDDASEPKPPRPENALQADTSTSSARSHSSAEQVDAPARSDPPPIVEVFVPIYPSSQFWIAYEVDTDSIASDAALKYIFFKLYLNGKQVITWGAGEKQHWKGKAIWSLFQGTSPFKGHQVVERRGFCFQEEDDPEDDLHDLGILELKVYRARGRKRADKVLEVAPGGPASTSIKMFDMGLVKGRDPQRFYKYALIDAVDRPYVTFKYRICTMNRLDDLGLVNRNRPVEDSPTRSVSPMVDRASTQVSFVSAISEDVDQDRPTTAQEYLYRGDGSASISPMEDMSMQVRRLSIPPSRRLRPSTSFREPSSPIKVDHGLPRLNLDQELDAVEAAEECIGLAETVLQTPSPGKSQDWVVASPSPSRGQRRTTKAILKGVVQSALRRRGSEGPSRERSPNGYQASSRASLTTEESESFLRSVSPTESEKQAENHGCGLKF